MKEVIGFGKRVSSTLGTLVPFLFFNCMQVSITTGVVRSPIGIPRLNSKTAIMEMEIIS